MQTQTTRENDVISTKFSQINQYQRCCKLV